MLHTITSPKCQPDAERYHLFNDFAVFDPSPLTQWINWLLVLIFAVLLSKLCTVLLGNYKIYFSRFSILKIVVLHHVRLSKIKS